ncbi:MAG TPA: ATP-binding protein [Longimicrobium sp.]
MSELPLLSLPLLREEDVVIARRRAREAAERAGFERQDATRIATAVSEIARNAYGYAGGGTVELFVADGSLAVRVADRGPGIPHLDEVLGGRYTSPTGLGAGITGARRLMNTFRIDTAEGRGTTVVMSMRLPPGARLGEAEVARIAAELVRAAPPEPVHELHEQNREVLRALAALEERKEELERLNRELEDTNRGVVALYAELDQRAEQLGQANDLKAQFLSYMSHEFRTPLDSILALSGLLLARTDGPLTEEQETQVGFVRRSARDLLDMVDDLLAASRMDAGQVKVRPSRFTVDDVYNAVRAMLRPLIDEKAPPLVWEAEPDLPDLHTDEAKVAQILRNLISNALKFTERGEVRISAARGSAQDTVVFRVADTGIGIAPEDRERIFRDFAQVESHLQRRVRGSGLGLPLSRKLAVLLGGDLGVESTPGAGSVFSLVIPFTYTEPAAQG